MIAFTNEITVDRPISEVYDYLVDLGNIPQWNWAITATTKISTGPTTVGTRYRQVRRAPRPATEIIEIAALQPNQHIEVRGTLAGLQARVAYDLVGTDRSTRVSNRVELAPGSLPPLVGRVAGPRISRSVADNLQTLKTHLERNPE